MKRKTRTRGPSRASLRGFPPIDFRRYGPGRANPFAERIRTEGRELVHEGPSPASLREIPELDARVRGRSNPYARRIEAQGIALQVGRGRPPTGTEVGPTQVKSVRLPPALWKRLEKQARADGMALHALVRAAIVEWLERHRAA